MRKGDLIHHTVTADKRLWVRAPEELLLVALEGMTMIQQHETYADADDDKSVEEIREHI